jgi:hypothetical protein
VKLRSLLAVGLAVNLGWVMAAPPVIGTVLAKGGFHLDGSTVMGNGTLFEGSTLETQQAGSSIQLSSGARLSLGAASRGKLYGDHILLERGETRLENGTGFRLVALGLTIRPERGTSTGRVVLEGNTRVRVTAFTGSFRVLNIRGVLVANLAAGAALAFEPQAAGATSTRITGVLKQQDGHFMVTDEVTKVNVEVTGPDLAAQVGQRVEITGTMDSAATPVSGASQVIRVTQIRSLPKAGPGGTAAAGSGGGASAAGISVGVIAIVGGVAAAAVLGGLAAAGGLPGQGDPSVSR